ncbi:glycosylated lysosomal membrane protein [Homo sapiens]|uniref:Glycosylated lysosomal membrane protein n=1 Tax=Homo sapiens TaxID=9606 RepID=V9GYZ8_HUMAN|nr:glycosylated lysosomal membrane protein [Homo sapiens]KAI4083209.1 glycosylated lysosomal membrane protein [Homo sapiens]
MRGSVECTWGWGHCAPSPLLLWTLLLFAAPFGLLGEKTRQVRRLGENQGEECRGESSSQLEGGTKDWGKAFGKTISSILLGRFLLEQHH